MTSPCISFLEGYADFLSNNGNDGDIKNKYPVPIFWNDLSCSGLQVPAWSGTYGLDSKTALIGVLSGNSGNTAPPINIKSLYIPSNWQVTISEHKFSGSTCDTHSGNYLTFPKVPQDAPVFLATSQSLIFEGTTTPIKSETCYVCVRPPPLAKSSKFTDYSSKWKYNMCTGAEHQTIGGFQILSFSEGSEECDTFMTSFCKSNKTDVACSCLEEEKWLKANYCEPGNTDPACKNDDSFAAFIPVSCFGKNCSESGYRFNRMNKQDCNTTLCQQIVSIIGNNIIVKGGAELWCGNKPAVPTVSPTTSPNNPNNESMPKVDFFGLKVSEWIMFVIGIAVVVLLVALPMAIITYKNSTKERVINNALNSNSRLVTSNSRLVSYGNQ